VKLKENTSLVKGNTASPLDRLQVDVVRMLAAVVETFEELLLRKSPRGTHWKTVRRSARLRVWERDQPSSLPRSWHLVLLPVDHGQWLLRSLDPQALLQQRSWLHVAASSVSELEENTAVLMTVCGLQRLI
jgi:hypothetical protein